MRLTFTTTRDATDLELAVYKAAIDLGAEGTVGRIAEHLGADLAPVAEALGNLASAGKLRITRAAST